jgi:hypothetical protein
MSTTDIQYHRGFGRDGLLLLVGNLNRRFRAFQPPFNFSFFQWRMTAYRHWKIIVRCGCYSHCVLGSETMSKKTLESFNVNAAVHGYNGKLEC